MKKTLSALEIRRQKFVLAILEGRSAADAARAAGYQGKDANMRIRAWELLRHPDIKARLQEMAKRAATEAIATITQRLERLSEIMLADDPGNCIKAIHEMNLMQRIYTTGTIVNVSQQMANVNVEGTREKLLRALDSIHKRIGSGAIAKDDSASRAEDVSAEEDTISSEKDPKFIGGD